MLVEAGQHLQPRRAVVHLVQVPPQQRHLVAGAMPPVVDEGDDQIPQQRTRERMQAAAPRARSQAFLLLLTTEPTAVATKAMAAVDAAFWATVCFPVCVPCRACMLLRPTRWSASPLQAARSARVRSFSVIESACFE